MRIVLVTILVLATAGFAPAVAQAKRHRRDPASPRSSSPSFVEFHSARVMNDLVLFHADVRTDDPLERTRRRDRLLLFRQDGRATAGAALGLGLFAAMTVMAAHMPEPLRVLFDRQTHLGPAIFEDGGMGAGVAGAIP